MRYIPTAEERPEGAVDVLVTIRPEHARRFYEGRKTFELRKAAPRITPRRLFLYETGDVKAITGHLTVARVIKGAPDAVWKRTREAGTSRARFRDYFNGSGVAIAFDISDVVWYRSPIKIADVRILDGGVRLPQNFLYLKNHPRLGNLLAITALTETLEQHKGRVHFKPIEPELHERFRTLVEAHIDGSYFETGRTYADKLIEISETPEDSEGIFSIRKHVIQISVKSRIAGFLVLTEKRGGCVKTGPVTLIEEFRGKGLGARMRQDLAEVLRRAGYRKIYCTVPSSNKPAISYLLRAGYKIEAHLRRHYHDRHDEIVFGYRLTNGVYTPQEFFRQFEIATRFERVTAETADIAAFIAEGFASAYCYVDWHWVARQVKLATSRDKSQFKPRLIYAARGMGGLIAVALCIFKRGGSVKILILSQTAHQRSISAFVQHIEKDILRRSREGIRKFYSHVAVTDTDTYSALRACQYGLEGVMEGPYSEAADMFALGKLVDSTAD